MKGKMVVIEFSIRCIPPKATAQQKGAFYNKALGRIQFFKKKDVAESETDYMTLFAPHVPAEPFRVPVRLDVSFVWPFRKTETKRVRERMLVPMTVKPDFDNLAKTLCDVMTKLFFWTDDSLVADGRIRKFWGASPGIHIRIVEIDELNAFDGIGEDTLAVFRQSDGNGNGNAPQEQDLFTDTGGL